MKKKIRVLVTVLLAAVFAVSTGLLARQHRDNAGAEQSYSDALALAAREQPAPETEATLPPPADTTPPRKVWIPAPVEEDPVMEEMQAIDLEALRAVNPEVIGWIRIPDTQIDYPILQGSDNDYYLNHTWEGKANSVGSIFMEYRNSPSFTDHNTILYGHNMNDGSMFNNLRMYTTQDYWQKRPYVYVRTEDTVLRYDIFASYLADTDCPAFGLSFRQSSTRREFLTYALEQTKIQTGIEPALTDPVLTLVTCSGAGYANRWTLQARLKLVEVELA